MIARYVDECGLSDAIELTGARRDIPDVLAVFDLFVLSSDREGHPLTALEAQAAGTPVRILPVNLPWPILTSSRWRIAARHFLSRFPDRILFWRMT